MTLKIYVWGKFWQSYDQRGSILHDWGNGSLLVIAENLVEARELAIVELGDAAQAYPGTVDTINNTAPIILPLSKQAFFTFGSS